ncbi:hypothetical protein [Micromonospora sp. ATCC 39149]|uniref:hypothetical protein n=1 Tax=Micromonospora sp. (strain ATCC 39149 / NRRL 15099 / SCC 1413) TaxID=219305 RepID=UPI00030C651D
MFAFDEFGPLAIRPQAGAGRAPRGHARLVRLTTAHVVSNETGVCLRLNTIPPQIGGWPVPREPLTQLK